MAAYDRSSPLIKTDKHYTAQQLYAAFEPMIPSEERERVRRVLDRVAVLSKLLRLDEVVASAIIWIETGAAGTGLPFRSRWYTERLNLGNLGVTGDDDQNEASQSWSTPEDAANGLMAHLVGYAYGNAWRSVWDAGDLGLPRTWDTRFYLAIENTPNSAGVKTVGDLNRRWAVDRDDDYGGKLAERANKLVAAMGPPVTTPSTPEEPVEQEQPMPYVYRRVPHPPFVDLPVSKPKGGGYGYTQIPAGSRKIVGVMNHETQGRGSGAWYRAFFSCPNGDRCGDALVDYLITRDGTIYRFNDPANDRSPWANGGPLGLEGDGPAFYARFGASGVNNSLISVEYEKLDNEDFTDAQIQSGGALNAFWHDQDGQDWESYPYATKYGCVTSLAHFEIGTTNCGKGELDDITKLQAVAKGVMKKWQTQADGPAVPDKPNVPDQPPVPTLPGGADPKEAAKAFGALTRWKPDGTTKKMPFDPTGPISLSYTHRCVESFGLDYSRWPKAEDWWQITDSGKVLDIVTFSNPWQLVRTAERQGIMWATFADAELETA